MQRAGRNRSEDRHQGISKCGVVIHRRKKSRGTGVSVPGKKETIILVAQDHLRIKCLLRLSVVD